MRATEERVLLAHLSEPPPRLVGGARGPPRRDGRGGRAGDGEGPRGAPRVGRGADAGGAAGARRCAGRLVLGLRGRDAPAARRRDARRGRRVQRRRAIPGRPALRRGRGAAGRGGERGAGARERPQRRPWPARASPRGAGAGEIPAGGARRGGARGRRRLPARRRLGRLQRNLQRLGLRGLPRALLPLQLAAARERARDPGLAFSQPLALAPSSSAAGGSPVSAWSPARCQRPGPSLLPAGFTAALAGALPRPEPVQLGTLQAYRYSGLSVHGLAGPLTLYAVPTAGGVATVACLLVSPPPPPPPPPSAQCAQIAATLKLNGTTAFGLAPSPQYAAALGRTFGALRAATARRHGPPARRLERFGAGRRGRPARRGLQLGGERARRG